MSRRIEPKQGIAAAGADPDVAIHWRNKHSLQVVDVIRGGLLLNDAVHDVGA